MKPHDKLYLQFGLTVACVCLLFCSSLSRATAQSAPGITTRRGSSGGPQSSPQGPVPGAPPGAMGAESSGTEGGIPLPSEVPETGSLTNDEIQVSFQGANIDMIVQWLAQTTGKSVIKHPQVQCQLNITSSKKVSRREAINLIYRALALEGFTAIESRDSIMIVPEGKEPKMNPVVVGPSQTGIPEGRQRLMKIFQLAHAQAGELKEKIRGVLSDKGTIETDDRANQLIVTDYTDNLRLVAELIEEFDVVSGGDVVIEIYPLKYAEAEELGTLVSLILNAQPAPPGASGSGRSSGSSPHLPGGGPVIMGGSSPDMNSQLPPSSAAGTAVQNASLQVKIWPDKTSNRLIVSAQKSKLPEVKRLIDILDTSKPEDVSVRVIPLKNLNAVDLVKELAPLYEKMSGKSLKDMIEVAANDRSDSLVVLSSEENFKAIEKLVTSLDTEDAQEKVMQTFTLKNADAQDVAKQLQDLGQNQNNSSTYPFFFFGGSPPSNAKKLSIVADRRRNAVIVQAPPAQMDGVAKMIKELDEPVAEDSLAPKIYHLKYVSAVDIEDVLNELFLKKQQSRSYWDYVFGNEDTSSSEDRDVGRLYGKVRITSEPYSNTIIVTSNSKENLAVVEEVLKQLDAPSEAGESTLRIGLKFAKASTVANSLNILFAKNGSPPLRPVAQPGQTGANNYQQQQQQPGTSSQSGFDLEQATKEEGYYPWLGGTPDDLRTSDGRSTARPVSDLVGRVRVVADERSNALLISANVHFFPQVLKLIEDLDGPTDQVLIEARIVEVSSDFLDQLGVRWSPDGSQFTADDLDNSILATTSGQYQKGFGGTTTVNTPASSTLPQALASLRSGVLSSTVNMDFLIQFLRRTTDATVLGDPQITINDNEMGKLFVGQRVPTLTGQVNPSIGGSSSSFVYQDVGVILEVTPHINDKGDVQLRIHAESSTVDSETVLGGAVFDSRAFKTDLTARNGQTLVLGGIIQKQITDTLRKTPILGDIPGLGWAFKKKDKTTHEVELMVFLRPRVIRSAADAKELLNEVDKKAPRVQKWQQDAQPVKKEPNTN